MTEEEGEFVTDSEIGISQLDRTMIKIGNPDTGCSASKGDVLCGYWVYKGRDDRRGDFTVAGTCCGLWVVQIWLES